MLSRKLLCALLAIAVLAASCATIIHGTTQEIGISSVPADAQVTVDGRTVGNTPVIADLSRKNQHLVTIELDGYMPYETTIMKSASGWVWGNLVFGGLIGLAVDAISGGFYKLSPEQVEAELRQQLSACPECEEGLVILAVLEPNPDWERIGALQRRE